MKEIDETTRKDYEKVTEPADPVAESKTSKINWSTVMKSVFGIFMIVVYVGMGVLLFINFFKWDPSWYWLRWVGGSIFVLYGVWRAYRQFMGIDSRL